MLENGQSKVTEGISVVFRWNVNFAKLKKWISKNNLKWVI